MTSERAGEMLREVLVARTMEATGLAADDQRVRGIQLAGAHLFGVAMARHVVRVPGIASLSHEALVDVVTPAIDHYVRGLAGGLSR